MKALPAEELKRQLRQAAQGAADKHREEFLSTRGVTCFSARNDSLLMWSHYGGRYKGFCLEFRTGYEPFTKVRKVHYTAVMPQFELVELIGEAGGDRVFELFCTKSSSWAYEEEWRAFHAEAGTLYTYEAEALKAIYFGPDIEEHDLDMICLVMSGQNPDVELYRGYRSAAEFTVKFERFTYRTFVEARRLGLL